MRAATVVPIVILGFVAGWISRSLYPTPELGSGDLLNAGVTLFVGWWLQHALRQRTEVDKVPLDRMARSCERLDDLIGDCLAAAVKQPQGGLNPDVSVTPILALRALANELEWMKVFLEALSIDGGVFELVFAEYLSFKQCLTSGQVPDLSGAHGAGHRLRVATLRAHLAVSSHVTDANTALTNLGRTEDHP